MKRMTMLALALATAAFAGRCFADEPAKKEPEAKAAPGASAEEAAPAPRASYAGGLVLGYRGTSVPLSGHQLAFLKKGDRVDMLVTFDAQVKNSREKVTATILQNVVVVDVIKPADLKDLGVVQLLLNPNEAQYAALAAIQGTIHIIARAEGDVEMHPMEMASLRKLFR